MPRSPASALFSTMAGCLLALAVTHMFASGLSANPRVPLAADICVGGALFALALLASRTLFRARPSLDYWIVGGAAIFCGAAMASYGVTKDFSFVIAASLVTFSATLASLFRDLDERVKGGPLLFSYLGGSSIAYLIALM